MHSAPFLELNSSKSSGFTMQGPPVLWLDYQNCIYCHGGAFIWCYIHVTLWKQSFKTNLMTPDLKIHVQFFLRNDSGTSKSVLQRCPIFITLTFTWIWSFVFLHPYLSSLTCLWWEDVPFTSQNPIVQQIQMNETQLGTLKERNKGHWHLRAISASGNATPSKSELQEQPPTPVANLIAQSSQYQITEPFKCRTGMSNGVHQAFRMQRHWEVPALHWWSGISQGCTLFFAPALGNLGQLAQLRGLLTAVSLSSCFA